MKTKKGDLLELFSKGKFDIIIHGCNCMCSMGAGIAKQIADQYPQASAADINGDVLKKYEKLSTYTSAVVQLNKSNHKYGIIFNLYTQLFPGNNLNLAALDLGLYKLSLKIPFDTRIGIPKIGCGIAGGNWRVVSKIIRKHFAKHNITVIDYDKN